MLELRPLGDHRGSVRRAGVVQVDIDGEAREIEHEQVERSPPFQRDAQLQERVAAQGVEQANEPDGFLERLGRKARCGGLPLQVLQREIHVISAHERVST